MTNTLHHGTFWDRNKTVALRSLLEGRFTRLFPAAAPADFDAADLVTLADAMTARPDIPPTPESVVDAEENRGIPSLYTYFGQFLDHDLTLDLERTAQAADRRSDIANASLAAGKGLQIGGNFGVLGSVGVLVDRCRPGQSAYRRTGIAELQFDRCNIM
jgi:hypothetical protein